MTPDLDDELREHFEPARRAQLPRGSFDRLSDRLREPAGRRARPFVTLAAAMVVILGVAAVVVETRSDGDQKVRSIDEPGSIATTATTTEPATVTTGTTPEAALGPRIVAAILDPDGDGFGDVVLVNGASGAVLRTIYEAPEPSSEPEGGSGGAVSVDVGPDGTIYYERCCEPAVGEVHGYDPNTSEDLGMVTFGTAPAVSPDGDQLAVWDGVTESIELVDVDDGDRTTLFGLGNDVETNVVTDLAWSPDGTTIAYELLRYQDGTFIGVAVGVSDVRTADSSTFTPEEGAAMPTFRPDGTLLLASPAHASDDGGPIVGDGVVIWDPSTQQVEGSLELDRVTSIDATADGTWVIAGRSGAPPHRIANATGVGDLGAIRAPDGLIDVAW